MTDGEKMIWAALFGHAYSSHEGLYRTDRMSKHSEDDQRNKHRIQSATLAAEAATRGVDAARCIRSSDIDHETAVMFSAMVECDGPDAEPLVIMCTDCGEIHARKEDCPQERHWTDCPKCFQRNGPDTDDCIAYHCTGCGHDYVPTPPV